MSEERQELCGIRGWLLFFILTLMVIGPLWKAWRTHSKWQEVASSHPEYAAGPEWAALNGVVWTSYGVATLVGILTGLILLKRRRATSVKITVVSLWVMGPIISIIGYFAALEKIGLEFALRDLTVLIAPTMSAAIWTAYLLKSRRVRNTYGFTGLFGASAGNMKVRPQT